MGGAVVVNAATRGLVKNLLGVAVIDVVEGSSQSTFHAQSLPAKAVNIRHGDGIIGTYASIPPKPTEQLQNASRSH